MNRSQER